jgi:hypothetical protein
VLWGKTVIQTLILRELIFEAIEIPGILLKSNFWDTIVILGVAPRIGQLRDVVFFASQAHQPVIIEEDYYSEADS